MKTLLLLLVGTCFAFSEEEKVNQLDMPKKVGQKNWCMKVTQTKPFAREPWRVSRVTFFQDDTPHTALDKPADYTITPPVVEWKLGSREEVDDTKEITGKFIRWCAIARANRVMSFTKPLTVSRIGHREEYVFVAENGKFFMTLNQEYGGNFKWSEWDVISIDTLLGRFPSAIGETEDKISALFK